MKIGKKLIYFVEKVYGDDMGRGKSTEVKRRQAHILKVRIRRFIKSLE